MGEVMNINFFPTAAAVAALLAAGLTPTAAATYTVNRYDDGNGPGTLRWAITQSNANSGDNTISIAKVGKGPYVIRLKSLLPALKGPVELKGFEHIDTGLPAPGIAIDGSAFINGDDEKSCPGEGGRGNGPNARSLFGPGIAVVDGGNVRISDLEIRSFCIGIMVLRSHDVRIDHDWIHNTAGAAGVLVTGDDGTPAGGSTRGLTANIIIENNRIYDTGDGGECTRGVSNVVYRFNTMWETRKRPNVPYSQGVECAGSNNDRVSFIGNDIRGYSDGLQLNGADNILVAGNTIAGTTYAITTGGSGLIVGNTITGNRMGIGPSPTAHVAISQNSIYDNGHSDIVSMAGSAGGTTDPSSPNLGGIDYITRDGGGPRAGRGAGQATSRGAPAAKEAPERRGPGTPPPPPPSAPQLSSASSWTKAPTLSGNLSGKPNEIYRVEFFANHGLDASGKGEGEAYIGATDVTTDAQGKAIFQFDGPGNPLGDGTARAYFTATATAPFGMTSAFSEPVQLGQ